MSQFSIFPARAHLNRQLVVQGYERSMGRLLPILRQLELTDRLTDLLVYRIYGLTDEEIRIVNERIGATDGPSR